MNAVLKPQSNAPSKSRPAARVAPDPLLWKPSVSTARRWCDLKVGHIVSQRCFEQTFVYAQIAMNMLTSYLPYAVTSEQFSQVNSIIKADFAKIESELSEELSRLDTMYKSATGETEWPEKDYTIWLERRVPYYTREAQHLLTLIAKFDDLMWYIDVLRFNEMISIEQKTGLVNRYKKLLMGLPRRMTELWKRTRNSLSRQRAAERAAEETKQVITHAESEGKVAPPDLDAVLENVDAQLSAHADAADAAMAADESLGNLPPVSDEA